jgi:hypothetical protein
MARPVDFSAIRIDPAPFQLVEKTSILKVRCCYITVDSAIAASQNGFNSYKLSINKKSNIMQIMTKNIKMFIYCETR